MDKESERNGLPNQITEFKNEVTALIDQLPERLTAEQAKTSRPRIERRNLIASIFIVTLVGLAFQEMIAAVRGSIDGLPMRMDTAILALAFFLTSMRFCIGNVLHLLSPKRAEEGNWNWFLDFLIIAFETVLLIFLGGACSGEGVCKSHLQFHSLLILLLAVDVMWITLQAILAEKTIRFKRRFNDIPSGWGVLNGILICYLLIMQDVCLPRGNLLTASLSAVPIAVLWYACHSIWMGKSLPFLSRFETIYSEGKWKALRSVLSPLSIIALLLVVVLHLNTSSIFLTTGLVAFGVVNLMRLQIKWRRSGSTVAQDLRRIFPLRVEKKVPYIWASLNVLMISTIFWLKGMPSVYCTPGLICLGALNLVAFITDVVLLDYYEMLKEPAFQNELL